MKHDDHYYVCASCGASKIRRDAEAEWNVETQKWELVETFDHFICLDETESCERFGQECDVERKFILAA